jgi:hypothetical protein
MLPFLQYEVQVRVPGRAVNGNATYSEYKYVVRVIGIHTQNEDHHGISSLRRPALPPLAPLRIK